MLTQNQPASIARRLFFSVALSAATIATTGCGSSTPPTAENKPANPTATASAPEDVSAATNVVAQFLDAIRRGGETGGANQMLTQHAQMVLQKLGRTVQPIGSPDAVFTVTRAEAVPEAPGAALVHSTWTEPTGNGTSESYQVVWALERESTNWKISGLAMDLQPGQEPMIVDFENASQMASLLNGDAPNTPNNPQGGDTVSQAPQGDAPIQR